MERRRNREISVRIRRTRGGSYIVTVEGRTFDVKDTLKGLGMRWDTDRKNWYKFFDDDGEAREFAENVKRTLRLP